MTAAADLIVRGRPVAVDDGYARLYRTTMPFVTVTIEETIKGTPLSQSDGTIEFFGSNDEPPDPNLQLDLPTDETVLFLINLAAIERRFGETVHDGDRYVYFLPDSSQPVLREVDGRVSVIYRDEIRQDYGEFFPLNLDGRPFDEVVAQIRHAVASQANSADELAPRGHLPPQSYAC